MDETQHEQFEEAVERKQQSSKRASEQPPAQPTRQGPAVAGEQAGLTETGRPQDVRDPRKKNSRHKKETADKSHQWAADAPRLWQIITEAASCSHLAAQLPYLGGRGVL